MTDDSDFHVKSQSAFDIDSDAIETKLVETDVTKTNVDVAPKEGIPAKESSKNLVWSEEKTFPERWVDTANFRTNAQLQGVGLGLFALRSVAMVSVLRDR